MLMPGWEYSVRSEPAYDTTRSLCVSGLALRGGIGGESTGWKCARRRYERACDEGEVQAARRISD